VPGVTYRALGHPVIVGAVYLLGIGNLFVHGLLIWDQPLLQAGGIVVGVVMLAVTAVMIRRGAFASRTVVELRRDRRTAGRSTLSVLSGGQPIAADHQPRRANGGALPSPHGVELPDGADPIEVVLPDDGARELKVWAHTITPEGVSERLPVRLTTGEREVEVPGELVLPLRGERRLTIEPAE
jgi:hypothetical protein